MLKAPEPDPIPKKPVPPKTDIFKAEEFITHGVALPGTFQAFPEAGAADLVRIQSVVPRLDKDKKPILDSAGRPVVTVGVPEVVRLAGVLVAPAGARGAQGAYNAVAGWVKGKTDLVVEQDPVYPTDPAGRRNVQIYFKGTSEATKDTTFNLNRMLVRSGFAVVDLYQASSIKPEAWLNDEQYARLRKDANGKPAPLGLWKLGIILGQRQAPPGMTQLAPAANGKPATNAPIGGATPDAAAGVAAPIGGATPTTSVR